ncbi:hypothetical protein [Neisseria montereyensis]|uniref:Uncharacterized protein n=1 Tax=Neisseria montereyensis TaxID=2973938 RepID=A0ABT2FEM6_9NEIS|nr:hypothetical protein [Neisseria montereyensis]MCS4534643.1 hypothetical protein [Neisseria montereyensis]
MSRVAVLDLYDYLEPLFMDNWRDDHNPDKDYAGCFVGLFIADIMPFSHLPAAEYYQACQWVEEAADKIESIRPYKSELMAALHADPRYKA